MWVTPTRVLANSTTVNIQPTCAPLEHVRRDVRFRQWLPGEDNRLHRRFQGGAPTMPPSRFGRTRHLVNRLAHVQGLGEAGAIKPLEAIANLKTSNPQGNAHEIDGPCSRKAQNVTARLYDSEHLPPHRRARDERVPCLAHESAATVLVIVPGKPMTQHFFSVRLAAKPIRRIGHHRVHALTR